MPMLAMGTQSANNKFKIVTNASSMLNTACSPEPSHW